MQSAHSLLEWQRRHIPVSFSPKHQLASLVQIRENKSSKKSALQKSQHSPVQAYLTGGFELEQADIPQLYLIILKVFSNLLIPVFTGISALVTGTERGTMFNAAF